MPEEYLQSFLFINVILFFQPGRGSALIGSNLATHPLNAEGSQERTGGF